VRATLADVAMTTPPAGLPPLAHLHELVVNTGWPAIESDPEALLSLGLCSPRWLDAALPKLRVAAAAVELGGHSLVHVDVRSDNLCLRNGRTLLFDWNQASVGNPLFDLAEWLPSLVAEGGPPPEELLLATDGAPFAAVFAGFWGARAGLPVPNWGPMLREMQRMQADAALSWAARGSGSSRAEVRRQNPPRTRLPWLGQRAGMVSARPHDGLRKRPHGDDAVAVALHERNVVRTRRGGARGAPVLSGHVPEALANAGDVAHARIEDCRPPRLLDRPVERVGDLDRPGYGRCRRQVSGLADRRLSGRAVIDPGDTRAADDRVDHLATVLAGEGASVAAAREAPARDVTDGAADHVFEPIRHSFGRAVARWGCPAVASC